MILVTGATGTTGSQLVEQLNGTGAPVRVLVRNPAKAERWRGSGVEIAQGDFAGPETLDAALAGVTKLFLLSAPGPQLVEAESSVVEAAKRAPAVQHVVKLSAIGAAADAPFRFGRLHAEIEQLIKDSGIAYTFLQPNGFMQNTLSFAGTIKSQGAFYAPAADGRMSMVDVRDVAAVAVRALTEPGHEGKTYVITGPEALSYTDVAEKLSAALGRQVNYVDVPPEAARQGIMASGMSAWMAAAIIELYQLWQDSAGQQTTPVIREVAKKEPITFDEFARDYVQVFQG